MKFTITGLTHLVLHRISRGPIVSQSPGTQVGILSTNQEGHSSQRKTLSCLPGKKLLDGQSAEGQLASLHCHPLLAHMLRGMVPAAEERLRGRHRKGLTTLDRKLTRGIWIGIGQTNHISTPVLKGY